jgi:hypothetical protein
MINRAWLLALVALAPLSAHARTVAIAPSAANAAGVRTAPLVLITDRPIQRVSGVVIDPSHLLALRASLIEAQIRERLAATELNRTSQLYRAGQNVSAASLERAQATHSLAQARLSAIRAALIAPYGTALADLATQPDGALARIAQGRAALVEVAVPDHPPLHAVARGRSGGPLMLRFVGMAAHVPPGLAGEGGYYVTSPIQAGPIQASPIQAGAVLAVRLPLGPPAQGYRIPASAVIYRQDFDGVFVRTAKNRFTFIRIDRAKGRFVPRAALPPHPVIAIDGAGLLLSLMKTRTATAADDDD